jgi:hypothetical protein
MDVIAAQIAALEEQQQREYAAYAAQLTQAIETRREQFELRVPVTITIPTALQAPEPGAWDAHSPQPFPRNVIEATIDSAISETPIP